MGKIIILTGAQNHFLIWGSPWPPLGHSLGQPRRYYQVRIYNRFSTLKISIIGILFQPGKMFTLMNTLELRQYLNGKWKCLKEDLKELNIYYHAECLLFYNDRVVKPYCSQRVFRLVWYVQSCILDLSDMYNLVSSNAMLC